MIGMSYSVDSGWKYLFSAILIISLICGSVIPIMYGISNKCRHHPATIILILCLLEMSATYQVFLDSVCLPELVTWLDENINLLKIVEYYGFDKITYQNKESLFTILCNFNQATMKLCILTELNYYIILTIDLILTLKKPFINPSKRMSYYNLCAILSALLLFFLNTDEEIEEYCKDFKCDRSKNYEIHITILAQLVVLFLGAILAIIFWCKDIKKSQQIDINILKNRRTYFQNHMILLSAVFFVWTLPLISYSIQWETDVNKRSGLKQIIADIYFTLNLLNPCIFLYIRLREPYYRQRFLLLLKGMFSEDSKNKVFSMDVQDMCSEEWEIPLGQLISMQTNQETVSNILSQLLLIISYDNQLVNPHLDRGIQKKMSGSYSDLSEGSPLKKNLLKSVRSNLQFTLEIEISEFAPGIFQQMRTSAGIDERQLQQSLRVDRNEQQIRKTQESMGKSGSFFFFSHDKKIVLKTLSKSEFQFILDIIPFYYEYMQNNHFSFIAKFYGCFKVQIIGFSTIYLLMMENTLEHFPDDKYLYDLKGSLVNRYTNVPPSQERRTTLKDRNFLESENVFIKLSKSQREELFNQLKLDTDFLCGLNIMDYSFLVAITNQPCYQSARKIITPEKSYCFSLIDFTQQFSTKKKIENLYKTLIRKKGSQISCIDPQNYKRRFQSFLNSVIIIEN